MHCRAIGSPTTWVRAKGCSAGDILAAIRAGQISLSWEPSGPLVELTCSEFGIGETAPRVRVAVEGLAVRVWGTSGDRLRLVTERGVVLDEPIRDGHSERIWHPEREAAHCLTFLRAELWRHSPDAHRWLPSALSNPLFFS